MATSKKEQFIQRCRDMDLKTARQAASVLVDELGISPGTSAVYFHEYLKSIGKAKKRPHRKSTHRGGSDAEGASNASDEIGGE